LERRYRYEARGYDFDKVQYRVAEVCKIDGKDVLLPGKQADRVRARSLLCYWAVRELGMSCTAIGRRLGMTQPAVSRAVQRGEKVAKGEKLEFYSGKVENVIFSWPSPYPCKSECKSEFLSIVDDLLKSCFTHYLLL
jgi:hypothetical protein